MLKKEPEDLKTANVARQVQSIEMKKWTESSVTPKASNDGAQEPPTSQRPRKAGQQAAAMT